MTESNCPQCGYHPETETEGARAIPTAPGAGSTSADLIEQSERAMMRVWEDAEVLRRHSTHHSEFILAAIARAAAAQALLVERLTWAVESMAKLAQEEGPYKPGQILLGGGPLRIAYIGAYDSSDGTVRHLYLTLNQGVTPVVFTVEAYFSSGRYAWSARADEVLKLWEARRMHREACEVMRETMAELSREER